jgi:hypothetical protein
VNELRAWPQRPREEAALLNPAFIGLILHQAAQTFEEESGQGLPFALAFLVPPVVVAESVRTALPSRKDSSLAAWLQSYPDIRLRFAEHAAAMVPIVREGLVFALAARSIRLSDTQIHASPLRRGVASAIASNTEDFRDVIRRTQFVGRWYANAGTTETIMALWGVRP